MIAAQFHPTLCEIDPGSDAAHGRSPWVLPLPVGSNRGIAIAANDAGQTVGDVGFVVTSLTSPPRTEDDRALRVTVSALGQKDWHAQVSQQLAPLQTGRSYTLTFATKADKTRSLVLVASVFGTDYHDLGLRRESLPLTTEWRTFRRVLPQAPLTAFPAVSLIL